MSMLYSEFRKTLFIRRKKLSRRRGTPWYRHRDAWKTELYRMAYWQPSPQDPSISWEMFKVSAVAWVVGKAVMHGMEVSEVIREKAIESYAAKLERRKERAKCST